MLPSVSFRKRYFGVVTLFLLFCLLIFNQMQSIDLQNEGSEEVEGWDFNRSRNVSDYILPEQYTTIISGKNICSKSKPPPRVLLIVCSSTVNFVLRNAIRKTWALSAHQKFNVSIAFLMGVSPNKQINGAIHVESRTYNDIIVEDFIDTYNNLTVKTLMMLKWVKNNCDSAAYVMKTDDDVYINIQELVKFLDNNPDDDPNTMLYGQVVCSVEPILDVNNKWFMPAYLYSAEKYPNYLNGYSYLMSTSTALRLYKEALQIPIIHIEDVFITGICAEQAGVRPSQPYVFHRRESDDIECSVEATSVVVYNHHVSSDEMFSIREILDSCDPNRTVSFFRWLFRRKARVQISNSTYYCD